MFTSTASSFRSDDEEASSAMIASELKTLNNANQFHNQIKWKLLHNTCLNFAMRLIWASSITIPPLIACLLRAAVGEEWKGDVDFRVSGFGGEEHTCVGIIDTYGPQSFDTCGRTAGAVMKELLFLKKKKGINFLKGK